MGPGVRLSDGHFLTETNPHDSVHPYQRPNFTIWGGLVGRFRDKLANLLKIERIISEFFL